MTKHLKLFSLFALVWSAIFFAVLDWCVDRPRNRWPAIVAAAAVYVFGLLAVGILTKISDSQRYAKYNLNVAYFVTSNIACLVAASVWIGFFKRQNLRVLLLLGLIFVTVDVIAWIFSHRTIHYKEEQELFE